MSKRPSGSAPWLFPILALAATGLAEPVAAGKQLKGIEPGPREQSAEERALEADPSAGIEHAVILLEEYERNEDLGSDLETHYHLRAKILSGEGRDLADIEIPGLDRDARLKTWWGRTIQPDGTVLELAQDDLERQLTGSTRSGDLESVKAALPGVVPGSVIDFGYVLREGGYYPYDRVPLQRAYHTNSFRYAWRPFGGMQGAYFLSRTEGLDVRQNTDGREITIEGRDIPAFSAEPWMPPSDAARAMLFLYYVPPGTDFKDYWKDMARAMSALVDGAYKKRGVQQALQEIRPAPEGDLDARLRSLYAWIEENLVREGLLSFEEQRLEVGDGKERQDIVRQLMESRRGNAFEINLFTIALARGLGAEAKLVFAVDRTDNYFNPQLKTFRQFSTTLVAVGPPGAGPDAMTVIDPGSGLPYGEVPWWYGGVATMMVGAKDMETIRIPLRGPDGARVVSRAQLAYLEDNELLSIRWESESEGQAGMSALRMLRRKSPADRERSLEDLCRTRADADLLEYEADGIDAVSHRFALKCELEEFVELSDSIGTYRTAFAGPWIQQVPDLPDGERLYPIVLEYPRYEETVVTIAAPDGFAPEGSPAPVDLSTSYGRYVLDFKPTPEGFEVTRRLALTQPAVPNHMYGEVRDFLERIREHDRSTVVFRRAGASAGSGS